MIFNFTKVKTLVLLLVLCALPSAFCQYASFYNRLSSVLVIQDSAPDASPSFGSISNRVVGRYDSEKFTLWGRAELTLSSDNNWNGEASAKASISEFAGAIRPFPFLEIMLGNGYGGSKGEFALTGYTMTGAFGYATEASYGLRKWADGEGLTLLFRGDSLGLKGFRFGWNALPILRDSQDDGWLQRNGKAEWYTTLSANYTLAQIVSFNLAARLDTAEDANQTVGIYAEFIGVPGLRANAGVTLDTRTQLADPFYSLVQLRAMAWYSTGNLFPVVSTDFQYPAILKEKGFSAAINGGIEYNFKNLGVPLLVAADMGITAGRRLIWEENTQVLPLLVGGLVQFNVTEPLSLRLQVRYADTLASNAEIRDSGISIMPRVHYNAGKWGEFRLEPVIMLTKTGTAAYNTGFLVGTFWQYNF